MSAYVIAYVRRVHDRKGLEAYWASVGPTFAGTGAKPISVYAPFQHVEGQGPVEGVVLVEFPDAETAHAWYFGKAYQAVKQLRSGAADIDLVIAEGSVVTNPESRMPHVK
jgi:uncharacterized protein (DUF1330 family)